MVDNNKTQFTPKTNADTIRGVAALFEPNTILVKPAPLNGCMRKSNLIFVAKPPTHQLIFTPKVKNISKFFVDFDVIRNPINVNLKMNDEQQKVNCGIWTILEILINKETNGKIWDKNENWLKPMVIKKKDKLVPNNKLR